MKRLPALLLAGLLAVGCPSVYPVYEPPESPRPLAPLNTEYDDYNTAVSPWFDGFVWSTNRGSKGGDFDLYRATVDFDAASNEPVLREGEPTPLAATASPGNEFGPIYVEGRSAKGGVEPAPDLVFASDRPGGAGGLDLYRMDAAGVIRPMTELNSPANDAYWSALPEEGPTLFASDRGGAGYDIYAVSAGGRIERVDALSSDADDTCPYLFAADERGVKFTELIFVSNRPGGQGGFDLWMSRLRDGRWDPPVNLGPEINSPNDEFRPCFPGWFPILVFSSNRPGGKGGFDLWYVARPAPFDVDREDAAR